MKWHNRVTICVIAISVISGCSARPSDLKFAVRAGDGQRPPLRRATAVSASAARKEVLQLRLAEDLISELKYPEAEELLLPLPGKFGDRNDVSNASQTIFWLGYCAEKLMRKSDAINNYDRVIREYPKTTAAVLASRRKISIASQ